MPKNVTFTYFADKQKTTQITNPEVLQEINRLREQNHQMKHNLMILKEKYEKEIQSVPLTPNYRLIHEFCDKKCHV